MRAASMLVLAVLLALLLDRPAAAQVTFTGVIEKATLPSICQEETHFLACTGPVPGSPTGVLLKSSSIDLTPFEGQVASFTALPRGVTCLVYDVTAVQMPPVGSLELCGSTAIGCPVRLRVGPPAIGTFVLALAFQPDFQPIDPVTGTLLLAPPLVLVAQGTTPPGLFEVAIPSIPALVGLGVWMQAGRMDVGPVGPLQLTNSVCFEIGPAPGSCDPLGC